MQGAPGRGTYLELDDGVRREVGVAGRLQALHTQLRQYTAQTRPALPHAGGDTYASQTVSIKMSNPTLLLKISNSSLRNRK